MLETAALDQTPVVIEVGDHPAHVVAELNAERAFVTDSATQEVVAEHQVGQGPNGISYQAP